MTSISLARSAVPRDPPPQLALPMLPRAIALPRRRPLLRALLLLLSRTPPAETTSPQAVARPGWTRQPRLAAPRCRRCHRRLRRRGRHVFDAAPRRRRARGCRVPLPRPERAGMTLLELMIAVAIVGVLVSTAGFLYARYLRKARSVEVAVVFAELHSRQEQHYVEHGRFLSTGASESDRWPPAPAGPREPVSIAPLPDTWRQLQIRLDRAAVYCAYVTMAGTADDATGPLARSFGLPAQPETDWYYSLAECDFDGRATNAQYLSSNLFTGIASRHDGR